MQLSRSTWFGPGGISSGLCWGLGLAVGVLLGFTEAENWGSSLAISFVIAALAPVALLSIGNLQRWRLHPRSAATDSHKLPPPSLWIWPQRTSAAWAACGALLLSVGLGIGLGTLRSHWAVERRTAAQIEAVHFRLSGTLTDVQPRWIELEADTVVVMGLRLGAAGRWQITYGTMALDASSPQPQLGQRWQVAGWHQPVPGLLPPDTLSNQALQSQARQWVGSMRADTLVCLTAKPNLAGRASAQQQQMAESLMGGCGGREGCELAAALSLGYRLGLDADDSMGFATAGVIHLLAISGLHVGLVVVLLLGLWTVGQWAIVALLTRLRLRQAGNLPPAWLSIGLVRLSHPGWGWLWVMVGLVGYVLLTGAGPSAIRAGWFAALGLGARVLWRRIPLWGLWGMLLGGWLLWDPAVIFAPGFVLSFGAVAGIMLWYVPVARRWRPRWRAFRWLRDLLLISAAAQLGALPFSLFFFGQFPTYFLVANVLAIPLALGLLYLGLIWSGLNAVGWAAGAGGLVPLMGWLGWGLHAWVRWINRWPGAVLEVSALDLQLLWQTGLLVVGLGLVWRWAWATLGRKSTALDFPLA